MADNAPPQPSPICVRAQHVFKECDTENDLIFSSLMRQQLVLNKIQSEKSEGGAGVKCSQLRHEGVLHEVHARACAAVQARHPSQAVASVASVARRRRNCLEANSRVRGQTE